MTKASLWKIALFAVAVALAGLAAPILYPADPGERIAITLVIALGFVGAGLVAWARRPHNGLGRLMTLLGFTLLLRKFQFGDPDDWLFTLGFLVRDLPWVVFGHIVLSYPTGRLQRRRERVFALVAYVTAVALPLVALLVHQPHTDDEVAGTSAIAIAPSADAFDAARQLEAFLIYGVLPLVLLGLIGAKLAEASPRARRMYVPLLVFGVILALRGLVEAIYSFADTSATAEDLLFWTGQAMEVALGAALVVTVFRVIKARAMLADALAELHGASPEGVRAALADALSDPELDVAFWVPERGLYMDENGAPYEFPVNDPSRSTTRITDADGEPLASLVHDAALENEPALVRDAAAAARLALENARLQAELRAQLLLVQESRARIVAAGDEERRRIERDLHDGAQQQLVTLGLAMRSAEGRIPTGQEHLKAEVGGFADRVTSLVEELREMSRGIHPAILSEGGLSPALEALALRSAVPVTLNVRHEQRLPDAVEVAAYYVASEALTNVSKHAEASLVELDLDLDDASLRLSIRDDGRGGADPSRGSGLLGLKDRVEALGGTIHIESPPGTGTRLRVAIPVHADSSAG